MTDSESSEPFPLDEESLEPVDASFDVSVRPTTTEGFAEAHVALHCPSGAAAWGPSREEAIEQVERDAGRVTTPDRTGEIVETPEVLGGKPRVAGSRIGVLHVVNAYDDTGSLIETAAQFSGPLTVGEARAALLWAEEYPGRIRQLREERARTRQAIEDEWDRLDLDDDTDVAVYHRDGSFALFGTDDEGP